MSSASLSGNGQTSGRSTPDVPSSSGHESFDRNGSLVLRSQSRTRNRDYVNPYRRQYSPADSSQQSLQRNESPRSLDRIMNDQNPPPANFPAPHSYVDKLAAEMRLTPQQAAILHQLADWGTNLDRGDLLIRISTRAGDLRLDNVLQKTFERDDKYQALLENVQQLLEDSWDMTKAQKKLVLSHAKDLIFEPLEIEYRRLGDRLKDAILPKPTEYGLPELKKNPHRMQVVKRELSASARSARNSYRKAIKETVFGSKKMNLDDAVKFLAGKFRLNPDEPTTPDHRVRVAILRRIARENSEVLNVEEAAPEVAEDNEDDMDIDDQNSTTLAGNARKPSRRGKSKVQAIVRNRGGNNTQADWWYCVDTWLGKKVKELGSELSNEGWKKFIEELYAAEESSDSSNTIGRRGMSALSSILSVVHRPSDNTSSSRSTTARQYRQPLSSAQDNTSSSSRSTTARPYRQPLSSAQVDSNTESVHAFGNELSSPPLSPLVSPSRNPIRPSNGVPMAPPSRLSTPSRGAMHSSGSADLHLPGINPHSMPADHDNRGFEPPLQAPAFSDNSRASGSHSYYNPEGTGLAGNLLHSPASRYPQTGLHPAHTPFNGGMAMHSGPYPPQNSQMQPSLGMGSSSFSQGARSQASSHSGHGLGNQSAYSSPQLAASTHSQGGHLHSSQTGGPGGMGWNGGHDGAPRQNMGAPYQGSYGVAGGMQWHGLEDH